MGEAKARGSKAERVARAIAAKGKAKAAAAQEARERWESMTEEEQEKHAALVALRRSL